MALERQSIEKKDFPIGRRGYDPDAVDAHLASVAAEVEELKKTSRRRSETLATSASEQVRAIVEAAENSAAEIQRQAEEDAAEIRAEASGEAKTAREQATDQARQYVGRVSESTAVMLQRLDAMESELSALIESLRTGSNRLNADLQLLEGNLTEVSEAVSPRPQFERDPSLDIAEPEAVALEAEALEAALEEPLAEVEIDEYIIEELETEPAPAAEPFPAAGPAGAEDDTEGARLIALNMALNGTPREETDRYLAENFQLSDRAGLLDEVYASVEG
ncbi:MAG TPA: DivIVA domain-containing protein [Solirubrobacteraceae bacterium]|nr:DivIVA domain-containing protein [Solirubrobacteraceae bacterium]